MECLKWKIVHRISIHKKKYYLNSLNIRMQLIDTAEGGGKKSVTAAKKQVNHVLLNNTKGGEGQRVDIHVSEVTAPLIIARERNHQAKCRRKHLLFLNTLLFLYVLFLWQQ